MCISLHVLVCPCLHISTLPPSVAYSVPMKLADNDTRHLHFSDSYLQIIMCRYKINSKLMTKLEQYKLHECFGIT